MSVGLGQDCDEGYIWIDSYIDTGCYNEEHIIFFQDIINGSLSTLNMEMDCNDDGIIEPLELSGSSFVNCFFLLNWNNNGDLTSLYLGNTGISHLPDYICEMDLQVWDIDLSNN